MRFPLIKTLAATALTSFHLAASATLINPLEYELNGLKWLQLSETAGLSLNDFATGAGGWNTKYRYALNSEIDGLMANFGLQLGDTGYQPNPFGAGEFLFAIGGMSDSGAAGTYFNDGTQGARGRGLNRYIWVELTNGENSTPLGPDCGIYTNCSRFVAMAGQSLDVRSSTTGLFLIRKNEVPPPPVSVPEPSSLALFGAGALLAYQRRKKKQ